MHHEIARAGGRRHDQLRSIKITRHAFGYAPGSVLFELGNTKVLCSVSLQLGVPPFLKGNKVGWLTAEYAMLPTAGQGRSVRESSQAKRNERSVEISRLIGRSLRAVTNLTTIGERTIFIDCDVLQADGSTRATSITGAYIALKMAEEQWLATKEIASPIITESVAAVSVGLMSGQPLLDIDFSEDSMIDADYNFVFTRSKKIIEIQGAAEKNTISWQEFDLIKEVAIRGSTELFTAIDQSSEEVLTSALPLFSLKNRLTHAG